jgi:hypothetical protein
MKPCPYASDLITAIGSRPAASRFASSKFARIAARWIVAIVGPLATVEAPLTLAWIAVGT